MEVLAWLFFFAARGENGKRILVRSVIQSLSCDSQTRNPPGKLSSDGERSNLETTKDTQGLTFDTEKGKTLEPACSQGLNNGVMRDNGNQRIFNLGISEIG